jgi:hypothetical protein
MSDRTDQSETDPAVVDPADAVLLDELRLAVAQIDAPPPRLLEAARAAYVWRTIDEDLAHLQFDSLAGSEVLVRGGSAVSGARDAGASGVHLSFATPEASIEVDVDADAILGQVVPAGASEVSLLRGAVVGPWRRAGPVPIRFPPHGSSSPGGPPGHR